ncbi:MAG TPA: Hsp20/alpha crystallin family protein [Candidatus Limnocylindrales bacterium]|nr:Hsp20/alpha crystallin family protein [Candidatus Limnocylindrales bacterium]
MRHRDDELLEFERLFGTHGAHGRFEPNADVSLDERDATIVVHVELAGADADTLQVVIGDASLTIAGARAPRDVSRDASLLRKEIQYGKFLKQIRLPVPVCEDGASATYRDGILTIRLPLAQSNQYPIVRTEIRMTVRRTTS